jgi:hypothetical protein
MEDREKIVTELDHSLQEALAAYMRDYDIVDLLQIDVVYDLRSLNITWEQLGNRLMCQFKHNVAFTKVLSANLERSNQCLAELLQDLAVVKRRPSLSSSSDTT